MNPVPPPLPTLPPDPLADASAKELVEIETRLAATAFEKGAAYTNLMIVAGYATFFGLWTVTKPYLPKTPALWAALLILISATTFVLFEVYKMYRSTAVLHARYSKLRDLIAGRPLDQVVLEYKRAEVESKQDLLTFLPAWRICLGITVVTGIAAVVILAVVFVIAIFHGAA